MVFLLAKKYKKEQYIARTTTKEVLLSRKKHKQPNSREIRIYPGVPKRKPLPRVAIVDRGGKNKVRYLLEYLTISELQSFWDANNQQKLEFLKSKFNRHHRKPRCQDGKTSPGNMSFVDIESHITYNFFIGVVARYSNTCSEKVRTNQVANFLNHFYPIFNKLFIEREGGLRKIKTLVPHEYGCLLEIVSRWARTPVENVSYAQLEDFLRRMQSILGRLAVDHDTRMLRSFEGFIGVLNDIWLPREEPIKMGAVISRRQVRR